MSTYEFRPDIVGSTLKARSHQGPSFAIRKNHEYSWEVPFALDSPNALFRMHRKGPQVHIESPFGSDSLEWDSLNRPDPLWESAAEICQHMEEDHADTFSVFASYSAGREMQEPLSMPWVEQSGFFLTSSTEFFWIPFPETCATPNEVRVSLIKELKRLRALSH